VRELGLDQVRLKAEQGVVFAVRRVEADYIQPARFDDALTVETSVEALTGARLVVKQDVTRDGVVLFSAIVTLVALGDDGRPVRLPDALRRTLH